MPKSKAKISKRRAVRRAARPRGKRGPACKPLAQGELLAAPDYGTTERWQHATRKYEIFEKDSASVVARVVEECALDALHMQGRISGAYRAAGLRLRHAYVRARVERPRIGRYDAQPRIQKGSGHPGFERSVREEEAYDEWREALQIVPLRSIDVVVSVCCIGDAPVPAQLGVLQEGLEELYRHYEKALYKKPKC